MSLRSRAHRPAHAGQERPRSDRRAAREPAYQATPILVLTTRIGEPFKEAARAAGATGWIEKPLDPDMLTELVAALSEAEPQG